jgi:hypothetical protein
VEVHETARLSRRRRRREARVDAIEEIRSQLATLAHDTREKVRAELAELIGGPFAR